ncbi:hypothetical protein PPERSA_05288 [Pseudocohnilembus persalinus]|uniref:Uncharacterized protein n=1 Tax=Pseudocohnilembus persalinus TaxID=266149 RepID=A0A0V0R6V7_PSEPJ|nr:hypothetical protein PPERSA_05288 [Pseudocohnilembus persalinus]|eukprot:KRX09896.1 hypothetical protein PPERSA_05288 [Pseudocohnilembus persalinus]
MVEKSNMQCQKDGHQSLKFLYLNMSSDNKEDLFLCPICISQQLTNKKEISQINLFIKHLKNDQVNNENLFGWPPIQDENHQKIYQIHQSNLKEFGQKNEHLFNYLKKKINDFYDNYQKQIIQEIQQKQKQTILQLENICNNFQNFDEEFINIQEIIKQFDIKDFREKFQEFQQKKIDIDQFFDFKQQQNAKVYNNDEIYNSLKAQQQNLEKLKKDLEIEFAKIDEATDPFKKYQPNLKIMPKKQQYLKFYKSNCNSHNNDGQFEIDNDQQLIKFNSNQRTYIYSENLQQQQEYHLRFTMDTKNRVQNIYLAFSLTSGVQKKSKDLFTDHYVIIFNGNGNSYANGREFQVSGKQFKEFFKDNETILNVVFNIEKEMMEIYDDDRISYQKLNFENYCGNFEEWVLGISFGKVTLFSNCTGSIIQFIE